MMTQACGKFRVLVTTAAIGLAAGFAGVANAHDPASALTGQGDAGAEATDLPVDRYPILESPHVENGPVPQTAYNSNPPTSGLHRSVPLDLGVYDAPVPDWVAVHNLEHGGIWISYQPGLDKAALAGLTQLAEHFPNAVVLSPRPEDDRPVIAAAWGRIMRLDTADLDKIERFIQIYINQSPEKFASLAHQRAAPPAPLAIGDRLPEFSLLDIDGQTVSGSTTLGKPTIFWFTTSWCVPCQIGARRVARLDTEMGGGAFDVVVIFVDPREKAADLKEWKTKYGEPDWIVAFDNWDAPLSGMTAVKYLDTKFLVDAKGRVVDVDVRVADRAYLDKITQATGRN